VAELDAQCDEAYTNLDDATRNVNNQNNGDACDDNLNGEWYRLTGASGTQMPTAAPGWEKCGTFGPGWMDGEHPGAWEQKVQRTACFQWKDQDCAFSTEMDVVNCGAFYLYRMPNVPQCSSRYCGEDGG
jgi:hypothetical protein